MFHQAGLMHEDIFNEIQSKKGSDWTPEFAKQVYSAMTEGGIYITNIGKCTQLDARPLPNRIFNSYKDLLFEELKLVHPKKIITFGNQVSSIFLEQPISVSKNRKEIFKAKVGENEINTLPVYYPVGHGQRNMPLAIEDIKWFLKQK